MFKLTQKSKFLMRLLVTVALITYIVYSWGRQNASLIGVSMMAGAFIRELVSDLEFLTARKTRKDNDT